MALANIETLVIGASKNNTESVLNLSGKIKTNEKTSSIQTAHFGGRIELLKHKSIGEYVKKGSFVATIYSPALVTAQNEFIEAFAIKNSQPELYKAVRNKLRNWKISEKQIQEIERTKKVITNFKMYANVSGTIDAILVQEGNHIKEGSPLFKVSNLGSVWAVFDVYEQDIKNLKVGQTILIQANAYADKKTKSMIDYIDPNLNTKTRTVAVRATLVNTDNRLKPGMLLSGEVSLKNNTTNSTNVQVPKTAVMWTGKRSIVYVKIDKNEPIFELREIELGNHLKNSYQILSGLENGEEIVINGTFTVDAVAQLQGKNSMMSPKKEALKKEKTTFPEKTSVSPVFKTQLSRVFETYISLKDAFVLSDAKKVSNQALQILSSLEKVQMSLLKSSETHTFWMHKAPKIKTLLEKIKSEQEIDKQRASFVLVSNEVIALANYFGVPKIIYVQHCPMANGNKGADWLSLEEAIQNPYFGDKMLRCGSVTQTLKSPM